MKKKEIAMVLDALKSIKMDSIKDKKFKESLCKNFFQLLAEDRKFKQESEDLETVRLSSYKEDREEVANLQREFNSTSDENKRAELVEKMNTHKEFLAVFGAYLREANELAEQTITLNNPIDPDTFMSEIQKTGIDFSTIEALYPLVKTK